MVYVPLNNTLGPNTTQSPRRTPLWRRLATVRWFIGGVIIAIAVYVVGMVYGWQYLGELLPYTKQDSVKATPTEDIIYGTSWIEGELEQWKQECTELGGRFNECGSACTGSGVICAQVCAARCEL